MSLGHLCVGRGRSHKRALLARGDGEKGGLKMEYNMAFLRPLDLIWEEEEEEEAAAVLVCFWELLKPKRAQ